MAPSASPAKVGDLIGGEFRLARVIGRGGACVVFEARRETTGGLVALKILRSDIARTPELLSRFEREARLAGSLDHENICAAADFGQTEDGTPFLVMPLLEGASLADILEENKSLPARRAADLIAQILGGLEAAHRAGIVHRDLTPANVFVTSAPSGAEVARLLDFGTAKLFSRDAEPEQTAPKIALGTPQYMAPEQARGDGELDHRADLYAAGAILFEMLTGETPYSGASYNEVMFKILSEPLPSPRRLNPRVPPPLEAIVIRAMAKDPGERFQTAAEMRAAVKAALGE
jgi:eukaryotic-like serine/threonine-protein kinase